MTAANSKQGISDLELEMQKLFAAHKIVLSKLISPNFRLHWTKYGQNFKFQGMKDEFIVTSLMTMMTLMSDDP